MSFLKKRNLQRFRIFVRRYFRRFSKNFESSEANKLDEIQKRALYTVRRMISKPDAVLLIAPISGISYVEWKHYFIRFSDTALTITNGKYSYYIWMPSSQLDKLKDIFYKNVEARRQKMEEKYDKRTLENLNLISEELQNDK
jgi:hypothetical protein